MTSHVRKLLIASLAVLAAPAALPAQTTASLDYSIDAFRESLHPWHTGVLELNHKAAWGSLIGRATVGRRFDQDGLQGEIEAYPRIGKQAYGFLSVGASGSELFPSRRYSAEIFGTVARAVELSAGVRHMEFDARNVTLYTGSAAVYPRGYYVVLRPFINTDADDVQMSANLQVRRYRMGTNDRDWTAFTIGGGRVVHERISSFELDRQSSIHFGLEGRVGLNGSTGLKWLAGVEREVLPSDQVRRRLTAGVGLARTF